MSMTREMLERLLEISRQMAETRTLTPLLKYAMGELLEFVNAEYGYLILLDEEGNLEFRVRQNRQGEEIARPESQISRTILERAIKERKALVIADALADESFQRAESVLDLKIQSVMCAPLITKGQLLGALYVENRSAKGVFDDEDLQPLLYFAAQAAVAIENAILNDDLEARVAARTAELRSTVTKLQREIEARKRAEEALQKLAITDPLTSVYNRRYFFDITRREIARARRHNLDLSLAMIDLDHFKEINDRYGHITGDQVLKSMAEAFSNNVRQSDVVGRYGGDEFIILMPECNQDEAHKTAERLRKKVIAQVRKIRRFQPPPTASIGLLTISPQAGLSAEEAIQRADQALYQAKAAGRNRVMAWRENMTAD